MKRYNCWQVGNWHCAVT